MNATIVELTIRQLLGRRRTLLMAGFALVPVAVAVLVRLAADDETDLARFTANGLLGTLVVATLLPLVALVMGTAALGAEIEDGTAVYLLGKPIPRLRIVLSKLLPAWLATATIVLASTIAAGAIGIGDAGDGDIVGAFAIAVVLGALVYCCLFICASVVTSRALIAGLVYVFLWEGTITRLFQGTRVLSVRQYTLGVADMLSETSERTFEARLGGTEALMLMAVVALGATLLAAWRLEHFEIGETT